MSDCYLPRMGGIEVQVHDLGAGLVAVGHDVEVFTATLGNAGERAGAIETVDGIPVHRFALALPGSVPVNPLAPPEVRRRLRAGGFDVAHVHMGVVSPFAVDMARVSLGLGLPTAITWHCVLDRSRPLLRAAGYARRWASAGAALSAVSSMAAARVSDIAGGAQVAVLPNGIDANRWAPVVPPVDPSRTTVRVTAAMRLARRKAPDRLVDVVADAVCALPAGTSLVVDVFGDGPQRAAMQSRIVRRGLEAVVRLRGRVGRDQLRAEHHRADLYLSVARLEAFGIAALEARTAGLPVLGLRGTGLDDFIVDGVNGRLVAADELAGALADLVLDGAARRAMARTNATVSPQQAWPTVIEDTLAQYRRAGAAWP
ncbi:MAG: glycosyltransferase family 4 protein [Nostocoides sp.]